MMKISGCIVLLTLAATFQALANDSRAEQKPLTLNDYHPFRSKPDNRADWDQKRSAIRDRILVGSGLWPLPTKTPLNTVVHGKVEYDDYSIEKVFFESMPGHFVTGSLYRPIGESLLHGLSEAGTRPGILCPHGHWTDGRFFNLEKHRGGMPAVEAQIAQGAERFVNAAQNPIQARCVQLARMGCIVLLYDTIGNGDSDQLIEHRRGTRKETNGRTPGDWGFVSPMAAAHLQTNFGLQTWNSIRALDFISNLAEVDSERLLVTGASGGATQTMMLAAIDDRIDAAFPAVMASTAMQGGCTCENTFYLRIGQGNIDIAAATAPRPLGLTAADDWTIELREKGHPDLVELFQLLGKRKNYEAHFDTHFKHNFNHVSRTHLYDFVNRQFDLGFEGIVLERDFEVLQEEDLTVWNDAHPKPDGDASGIAHEKALCRWWHDDAQAHFADLTKDEAASKLKTAVSVMIGRPLPAPNEVEFELIEKTRAGDEFHFTGIVRNHQHNEEIPVTFRFPADDIWDGSVTVVLSEKGKSAIFNNNYPQSTAVMGIDLYEADQNPPVTHEKASEPGHGWRISPVYYYGYNHSIFARRVHDVLSCLTMIHQQENWSVDSVVIDAREGIMPAIGACAKVLATDAVTELEFGDAKIAFPVPEGADFWDADFLPGGAKYQSLFEMIF